MLIEVKLYGSVCLGPHIPVVSSMGGTRFGLCRLLHKLWLCLKWSTTLATQPDLCDSNVFPYIFILRQISLKTSANWETILATYLLLWWKYCILTGSAKVCFIANGPTSCGHAALSHHESGFNTTLRIFRAARLIQTCWYWNLLNSWTLLTIKEAVAICCSQ